MFPRVACARFGSRAQLGFNRGALKVLPNGFHGVDRWQQLDRLMEIVKRLPPKCQQVFILARFHDMDYSEIAARCGITVKTVEKHVASIYDKLRVRSRAQVALLVSGALEPGRSA